MGQGWRGEERSNPASIRGFNPGLPSGFHPTVERLRSHVLD